MSDWRTFHGETIEENLQYAYAQPFSSNFETQAAICGIGFSINYEELAKDLATEPPSRALSVLEYQIKRYRHIIPELVVEKKKSRQDREWER